METAILASSKSLTVTCIMVFTLASSVLYKCYKEGNFTTTFWMALGLMGFFGAESLLRGWWTAWRTRYMARDASAWMIDHWVVLALSLIMIASGLLLIWSLTDESPYGRLWKLCLFVVLCVFGMSYFGR